MLFKSPWGVRIKHGILYNSGNQLSLITSSEVFTQELAYIFIGEFDLTSHTQKGFKCMRFMNNAFPLHWQFSCDTNWHQIILYEM